MNYKSSTFKSKSPKKARRQNLVVSHNISDSINHNFAAEVDGFDDYDDEEEKEQKVMTKQSFKLKNRKKSTKKKERESERLPPLNIDKTPVAKKKRKRMKKKLKERVEIVGQNKLNSDSGS